MLPRTLIVSLLLLVLIETVVSEDDGISWWVPSGPALRYGSTLPTHPSVHFLHPTGELWGCSGVLGKVNLVGVDPWPGRTLALNPPPSSSAKVIHDPLDTSLCVAHSTGYWMYNICYKGAVTQEHRERDSDGVWHTKIVHLLGKFSRVVESKETVEVHDHHKDGEACWNEDISEWHSRARESSVRWTCGGAGGKARVTSVREDAMCSYEIIVGIPSLCKGGKRANDDNGPPGLVCGGQAILHSEGEETTRHSHQSSKLHRSSLSADDDEFGSTLTEFELWADWYNLFELGEEGEDIRQHIEHSNVLGLRVIIEAWDAVQTAKLFTFDGRADLVRADALLRSIGTIDESGKGWNHIWNCIATLETEVRRRGYSANMPGIRRGSLVASVLSLPLGSEGTRVDGLSHKHQRNSLALEFSRRSKRLISDLYAAGEVSAPLTARSDLTRVLFVADTLLLPLDAVHPAFKEVFSKPWWAGWLKNVLTDPTIALRSHVDKLFTDVGVVGESLWAQIRVDYGRLVAALATMDLPDPSDWPSSLPRNRLPEVLEQGVLGVYSRRTGKSEFPSDWLDEDAEILLRRSRPPSHPKKMGSYGSDTGDIVNDGDVVNSDLYFAEEELVMEIVEIVEDDSIDDDSVSSENALSSSATTHHDVDPIVIEINSRANNDDDKKVDSTSTTIPPPAPLTKTRKDMQKARANTPEHGYAAA